MGTFEAFYASELQGVWALLLDPFDDWYGVDCPRLGDLTELARAMEIARRSD